MSVCSDSGVALKIKWRSISGAIGADATSRSVMARDETGHARSLTANRVETRGFGVSDLVIHSARERRASALTPRTSALSAPL